MNNNLEKLLDITEIKHNGDLNSIAYAVNNRETGWLRVGERWQQQEKIDKKYYDEIYNLAAGLGYIEAIRPEIVDLYDRAIILGTASPGVRTRLSSMIEAWQLGNKWQRTIALGSDRRLNEPESDKALIPQLKEKNYQATECGMMEYIYNVEYAKLIPSELKKVPILFVNTIAPVNKNRADTADTIIKWLEEDDIKGDEKILVFSNQPYIKYQDQVIKYILKKKGFGNIKVNTVGAKAAHNIPIANILDSIAKKLSYLVKR